MDTLAAFDAAYRQWWRGDAEFKEADQALDASINRFFARDVEFKEEDVNRQPKGASGGHGGEFASQETGAAAAEPEKKPKDRPALERDLSYRDILYGDYPAAKPRSKTVPVIARDLMQRGTTALKALGIESGRIEGPNPETDQLLARVIASEVKEALGKAGHAGDWYTKRVTQAMNIAAEMYPELATDPHARTSYTAALAITSQGEVVPSNVRLADQAYRHYRETGRFPTDIQAKERIAMNTNFKKLNAVLDAVGPEGMTEFLNKDYKVRELEAMGHKIGGELQDTDVKGSVILGAKIGQGFFQNLNGNYTPVTMDLWFMRGWGRLTGTLQGQLDPKEFDKTRHRFETALTQAGETPPTDLADLKQRAEAIASQHERDFVKYRAEYDAGTRKKSEKVLSAQRLVYAIDGVNQAPSSGGQRNWMRSVVDRAREELKKEGINLTNADMQAIWWYPEKDLYAKLGSRESRTVNVDYATALEDLARKHGISEEAVTRALGTVDRRPRRATGRDDGRAVEGIRREGQGITGKEKADLDREIADFFSGGFDRKIAFFGNDRTFDAAVNGFFAHDWVKPNWGGDAIDASINAFFASDAGFKEEEHPRKQSGQFTRKGTGEAPSEALPPAPRVPTEISGALKDHGFRRSKPSSSWTADPYEVEFVNDKTGEELRIRRDGKDIEWQLGRQEDKYTWAHVSSGKVSSGTGNWYPLDIAIRRSTVVGKARQAEKAKAEEAAKVEQAKTEAAEAEKRIAAAGPGWSSGALRVTEASEISGQFKADLSAALDAIPGSIRERLGDFGVTVRTGAFLTDIDPSLHGVTPRGWGVGTWDAAEGMYDTGKKQIVCTEFRKRDTLKEPGRGKGVLWHESGHAFDAALGRLSHADRFKLAYAKDTDATAMSWDVRGKLGYFLQPDEAGREETFAEVFGWEMGSGSATFDVRQHFPNVTELVHDAIQHPQSMMA